MAGRERPLWQCPRCGHAFVTRNLWHSCGNYTLEHHFRDKPVFVRELFDLLVETVRGFGPFKIELQKTRIVFQVRVRFAGGHPLKGTSHRRWCAGSARPIGSAARST